MANKIALTLLSSSRNNPIKTKLLLSRLSLTFYLNQFSTRVNSSRQQNYDERRYNNESTIKYTNYFSYLGVLAPVLYLGFSLCYYNDEVKSKLHFLKNFIFPVASAANFPHIPFETGNMRSKFNFIADVVEISAPAVVYIEIKDQKRIDVFTGKPATTSNGSGFIIKEDGLILTNAHVVTNRPYAQVKVRLQDGSTYTGTVEDVDFHSDLATVRINKKNLPVMKLGSSAKLRPGEFVVAIGSPLALSNSITSGVISSVNRQSQELGLHHKNMEYIQTDAAITFGNSGGPLVNLDGEAIGINAMKVTAGISFAIPIDYAKEFLKKTEEKKKKGAVDMSSRDLDSTRRRYLGITMVTLTPDILHDMQHQTGAAFTSVRHGVLIWKVMYGSPAHVGGLKPGDIITNVNSESVKSSADIYKALEKSGPIVMTIVRGGVNIHVEVQPEDAVL